MSYDLRQNSHTCKSPRTCTSRTPRWTGISSSAVDPVDPVKLIFPVAPGIPIDPACPFAPTDPDGPTIPCTPG